MNYETPSTRWEESGEIRGKAERGKNWDSFTKTKENEVMGRQKVRELTDSYYTMKL